MSFASAFSRLIPMRSRYVSPSVIFALCWFAATPASVHAQAPGSQDTTFVSQATGSTVFTLSLLKLNATPLIFVGGDIGALSELDPGGSVDPSFQSPGFGALNRLTYVSAPELVLTDSSTPKVIVGGLFGRSAVQQAAGQRSQNITRLEPDGKQDPNFNPGDGANGFVTAVLPLPDGRIIACGEFTSFNKQVRNHIVRLNNDGSIDGSFASNLNISDTVLAVASQIDPATGAPSDQILVAGTFNNVNGAPITKIARINGDGTLDSSFKATIDSRVLALAPQPDGGVIIGGDFTAVNGVAVQHIARLNRDGSLHTPFSAVVTGEPTGVTAPVAVYVFKELADGRLYAGGNFTTVNGVPRNYLALIQPDGTLDLSFDPGQSILNSVQAIAVQDDNKVLVGQTLGKRVNNLFPPSLIRLYGVSSGLAQTVSIKGTQTPISETAKGHGRFKLTRQGDLTVPLTVFLQRGGTAKGGTDYLKLALTKFSGKGPSKIYEVTFPAGTASVKIQVLALGSTLTVPETLTLTLIPDQSGHAYNIGAGSAATVTFTP